MTDDELNMWFELTDHLPPEELPPEAAGTGAARPRLFALQQEDPRFPACIVLPRLLSGAPSRVQRELLGTLVLEVTNTCPGCHADRLDGQDTRHIGGCFLRDFPKRVRGWLVPGTLAAVAAYMSISRQQGRSDG